MGLEFDGVRWVVAARGVLARAVLVRGVGVGVCSSQNCVMFDFVDPTQVLHSRFVGGSIGFVDWISIGGDSCVRGEVSIVLAVAFLGFIGCGRFAAQVVIDGNWGSVDMETRVDVQVLIGFLIGVWNLLQGKRYLTSTFLC
ncbi:hypothetical protein Drorol1_Dr00012201 [Drosera rotundifolia]